MKKLSSATLLGLLLAACLSPAFAQAPAIQRTVLQRTEMPGENRDVLLVRVEIAPGSSAGRHFHPGVETGYVIEGESRLEIEGEEARIIRAGDSYLIPAGRVHDAITVGERAVKVVAAFVVERGKPLATPAK